MASRKVTFTLPEDVAEQLFRRVPSRDRSRYVTQAIIQKLEDRDKRLILSCDVANADPEVLAIEREWDALRDVVAEPWNDAPAR
jgi:hypothetical protein